MVQREDTSMHNACMHVVRGEEQWARNSRDFEVTSLVIFESP